MNIVLLQNCLGLFKRERTGATPAIVSATQGDKECADLAVTPSCRRSIRQRQFKAGSCSLLTHQSSPSPAMDKLKSMIGSNPDAVEQAGKKAGQMVEQAVKSALSGKDGQKGKTKAGGQAGPKVEGQGGGKAGVKVEGQGGGQAGVKVEGQGGGQAGVKVEGQKGGAEAKKQGEGDFDLDDALSAI
ncbi:circumsporozoite protein isoform X1 [Oryzias latipes]|uniref:circumsporozoite protein isoform X1 n=2 Tax=Oryzias latipes TaxID=8090 RepID=UPI0002A48A61|nr:circumsporozoite protein isoform X1 [Oryzias latipes]